MRSTKLEENNSNRRLFDVSWQPFSETLDSSETRCWYQLLIMRACRVDHHIHWLCYHPLKEINWLSKVWRKNYRPSSSLDKLCCKEKHASCNPSGCAFKRRNKVNENSPNGKLSESCFWHEWWLIQIMSALSPIVNCRFSRINYRYPSAIQALSHWCQNRLFRLKGALPRFSRCGLFNQVC